MANELRISSLLTPVVDTSTSTGGQTYTEKSIDSNTGKGGGDYNSLPAYAVGAIVKHSGVVNATIATAIATAFESVTTVGTQPTLPTVIAVKYESALGSPGVVVVTIGSQVHANLSAGEGCVIPVAGASNAGLGVANFKIHNAGYVNGTKEATVSVILAGAS